VSFDPLPEFTEQAQQIAHMHVLALDASHAGLTLDGTDACQQTPAWNPMASFPVNSSDGPSEWLPCLPLGTPMVNHRAVTLLHRKLLAGSARAIRNAYRKTITGRRRWSC
jgi:hypothetical protein